MRRRFLQLYLPLKDFVLLREHGTNPEIEILEGLHVVHLLDLACNIRLTETTHHRNGTHHHRQQPILAKAILKLLPDHRCAQDQEAEGLGLVQGAVDSERPPPSNSIPFYRFYFSGSGIKFEGIK